MATRYSKDKYARVKSLKNKPLSLLTLGSKKRKLEEGKDKTPAPLSLFGTLSSPMHSLEMMTFYKERLPALNNNNADNTRNDDVLVGFGQIGNRHRRSIRRIRNELNSLSWQPRSLPWRRSFGRPESVPLDVIAERKLQWRASIYSRRLLAVSSPCQNCREQNVSGNIGAKERIVHRIGPWIRRELQAILGDPDPSVIVHVASSLFIASLENNISVHSEQLNVEDESIAPLHRFLIG